MPRLTVHVAAIPMVAENDIDGDDRNVAGTYEVSLKCGVLRKQIANAALDSFHSNVAVSVLDDFRFVVFSPITGEVFVQDDETEDYSLTELASKPEYVGTSLPKLYNVSGDNKSPMFAAANRKMAAHFASAFLGAEINKQALVSLS